MSLLRNLHVSALACWLGAAAAGCGNNGVTSPPDAGTTGTGGQGGHGGHGGQSGLGGWGIPNDCPGQCVPLSPSGWNEPSLAWFGDEKDAPECPITAPKVSYEGYADLVAPIDCGTCSCAPPAGSCSLPASMTANAATCALNDPSTAHTPFDPASGWGGACDTNESIPSGKLCSGIKCVQSLSIGPMSLSEGACSPSQSPAQVAPTWKTFVRECRTNPFIACGAPGLSCAGAPTPGFKVCVALAGDHDCVGAPFPPYTEKHLFYGSFTDTRACSACTCDAPAGSTCSAAVSVYTDGACSTLAYTTTASATGLVCHDLPAGSALGSKSATAPVYAPGACAAGGGQPMGAVTPAEPATFCCIPSP